MLQLRLMLDLPREEMAIRKIYRELVEQQKLTTVFRPGQRLCEDYRGYCQNEIITIKIVDRVGADWALLAPVFAPDFAKAVKIENITSLPLGSLTAADFAGSTPDVFDRQSLRYHLGIIYNLAPDDLGDDSLVTKICFSYTGQ